MGWTNKLIGYVSGNGVEVDANNRLLVNLADAATAPSQVGGVRMFSEVDSGSVTGVPDLNSPEVDDDYRMRVAHEQLMDYETFNYTTQNTGKHRYAFTTMTGAWTANGFQTNSGGGIATTTNCWLQTWAYFPLYGASDLYMEFEGSFNTSTYPSNTTLDFGMFICSGASPFTPTDGAYFRVASPGTAGTGIYGIINYNTVETVIGPFDVSFGGVNWTPVVNQKYQFIISINERQCEFWINNVLMGTLLTPPSNGQPFQSACLPVAIRHAIIGGSAVTAFQFLLSDYTVTTGGPNIVETLGVLGNRCLGSYQTLSGAVGHGSLANYANNGVPVAAVPTNTTQGPLTGTGLGCQCYETATVALALDAIIMSYQVPLGSVAIQGRRLKINGIYLASVVQTVLIGGPVNVMWSLAFGSTALSLATPETGSGVTATTKAPRRIPLPAFTQTVTAAQAVNTAVAQPSAYMQFLNPIYVNPGEWVCMVKKHIGTTVFTGGVFAHQIAFDAGWE